jgi:hypothetical protein
MNVSLLNEPTFHTKIKEEWERCKKHATYYPNRVTWWDRYVKRMIRQTFQNEGTGRRRDHVTMENLYYEAIYDTLQDPTHHAAKASTLKRLKAKIVRLNSVQKRGVLLDNADQGKIKGEDISIYHYISSLKSQKAPTVNLIYDNDGSPK